MHNHIATSIPCQSTHSNIRCTADTYGNASATATQKNEIIRERTAVTKTVLLLLMPKN